MNACPYCGRSWDQHFTRCEAGVPPVDLHDERGLAGRSISGYRILGGIGKGGMGTVYLALDNITEGQLDAVKILNRDLVVDRERLRREAVTANRVNHPNVCKIYNYVEGFDPELGATLTLVAMELVRGPTLKEVQEERGGTLELSQAALVVKEVAEALTAIHSQDIVHRDIKPTNIIVTRDPGQPERVKIVDFGIAKAVGGGADQDLTEPGFVAATVHYAPPELLRGKPEKRSDVYALGVVLFEILTGRRPFEATNQAELFSMILDPAVRIPSLDQARAGMAVPPGLQEVLNRALERDPEARFATPGEFSHALLDCVPQLAETVRIPVADLPPEAPLNLSSPVPPGQPETQAHPSPPRPTGAPGGAAAAATPGRAATQGGTAAPGGPGSPVAAQPPRRVPSSPASPQGTPGSGDGGLSWKSPPVFWGGIVGGVLSIAVVLFLLMAKWDLFGGGTAPDPDSLVQDRDTAQIVEPAVPGPPAHVILMPTTVTLTPEGREQVTASVTDAQDNPLPDLVLRWTSSDPGVAEVDEMGTIRARRQGSAVVRAEVSGVWNEVEVEVGAPPNAPVDTQPRPPACPDPAMDTLDRLEMAMDDSQGSRQDIREGALACWNRGGALSDEERAYAAWLIGLNTVEIEGCSQSAILWLDRAVQLEPESEAYRVARQACGEEAG